jgi:hypothetical protein
MKKQIYKMLICRICDGPLTRPPLSDLQLYKEIEICPKVTQNIHIEKSDAAADNYGRFLFVFGLGCLCFQLKHFICKQN